MDRAADSAGRRIERIRSSPNFRDGVVRNILPTPRMDRPWAIDNLTRMGMTSLELLDRGVERVPRRQVVRHPEEATFPVVVHYTSTNRNYYNK